MAEAAAATAEKKTKKPAAAPTDRAAKGEARKKLRAEARKARAQKLKTDPEFAKSHFAGKSKRSTEKKQAFRRRFKGKK